jgi:hypothetical protein
MSETNADHVQRARSVYVADCCPSCASVEHLASIVSAPGVVDLDPAHTAEILTWLVELGRLSIATKYTTAWAAWSKLWDHIDTCPPHVAEALRKVTS